MSFSYVNAQKTEKIVFKSANPFALSDIITDLENQQKQEVFGKLTFPHDSLVKEEKYPLIIGVAGSLGWREHHYEYMEMYQGSGFATFELNILKVEIFHLLLVHKLKLLPRQLF